MTIQNNAPDISWEQMALESAEAIEVMVRVGIVRSANHAQIQFECHDVGLGTLIALSSWPFLDLPQLEARLPEVLADFARFVLRQSGPFVD